MPKDLLERELKTAAEVMSEVLKESTNLPSGKTLEQNNSFLENSLSSELFVEDSVLAFNINDYFQPAPGTREARLLGSGAAGSVHLFQFKYFKTNSASLTLEQQKIKKIIAPLCDEDGLIVIKTGKISEEEKKIADIISQKPGNQAYNRVVRVKNQAIDKEVILSRYVYCWKSPDENKSGKKKIKSYPLDSFLSKFSSITQHKPTAFINGSAHEVGLKTREFHSKLNNDYSIWAQLFDNIRQSINSFHEAGLLHFDIAPRNILMDKFIMEGDQIIGVTTCLIDYGHAHQYSKEAGYSTIDIDNEQKIPLNSTDLTYIRSNDNNNPGQRVITTSTDFYAHRIAMLNLLENLLDHEESSLVFVNPNYKKSDSEGALQRFLYPDDSTVLTHYLENIKSAIKYKNNNTETKAYFKNIIDDKIHALCAAAHTEDVSDMQAFHIPLAGISNEINQTIIQKFEHKISQYSDEMANYSSEIQPIIQNINKQNELINSAESKRERFANSQKLYLLQQKFIKCNRRAADIYNENVENKKQLEHFKILKSNLDILTGLLKSSEAQEPDVARAQIKEAYDTFISYLKHWKEMIDIQKTSSQIAATLVNCYGGYIKSAPWNSTDNPSEFETFNNQAFIAANELFFISTIQDRLASLSTETAILSNDLQLSFKRLLIIEVSSAFRESPIYKTITDFCLNKTELDVAQIKLLVDALENYSNPNGHQKFVDFEQKLASGTANHMNNHIAMPPFPDQETRSTDANIGLLYSKNSSAAHDEYAQIPKGAVDLDIDLTNARNSSRVHEGYVEIPKSNKKQINAINADTSSSNIEKQSHQKSPYEPFGEPQPGAPFDSSDPAIATYRKYNQLIQKQLIHNPDSLIRTFTENILFCSEIFFSKKPPYPHYFAKKKEVIASLHSMTKAMDNFELLTPTQQYELLYPIHGNQTFESKIFTELKPRKLKIAFNFKSYIALIARLLDNFSYNLDQIKNVNHLIGLESLATDFRQFKTSILSKEKIQEYYEWLKFDTSDRIDIYQLVNEAEKRLMGKLEQLQPVAAVHSPETPTPVTICLRPLQPLSEQPSSISNQLTTMSPSSSSSTSSESKTRENATDSDQINKKWQKQLKLGSRWQSDYTADANIISVTLKKPDLQFTVNKANHTYSYSRDQQNPDLNAKKRSEAEQIIAIKMARAFKRSGNSVAVLSGDEKLCGLVANILRKSNHIKKITINERPFDINNPSASLTSKMSKHI